MLSDFYHLLCCATDYNGNRKITEILLSYLDYFLDDFVINFNEVDTACDVAGFYFSACDVKDFALLAFGKL